MTLTRASALFVGLLVTIAGCGGGSTPREDAGSGGGNDTGAVGIDVGMSADDAAVVGDDAAVLDDAAVVADDTGSTASGACTNAADTTRLGMPGISDIIETCTRPFGAEPRTRDCIRMMSGLTMACADCFDGTVRCTIQHCAGMCAGGDSPACTTCRMNNCDAPFTACSGTAP